MHALADRFSGLAGNLRKLPSRELKDSGRAGALSSIALAALAQRIRDTQPLDESKASRMTPEPRARLVSERRRWTFHELTKQRQPIVVEATKLRYVGADAAEGIKPEGR